MNTECSLLSVVRTFCSAVTSLLSQECFQKQDCTAPHSKPLHGLAPPTLSNSSFAFYVSNIRLHTLKFLQFQCSFHWECPFPSVRPPVPKTHFYKDIYSRNYAVISTTTCHKVPPVHMDTTSLLHCATINCNTFYTEA